MIQYRFGVEGDLTAPSDDRLTVGDPRVIDFLAKLARKLLAPAVARRHPELGSLGFFLRPAELHRTVEHMKNGDALVFPRGNVFHIPPANVDTIFVYSWALSALAGNHNVVRISERSATAADTILTALNEVLADADPVIARTQRMITYGRDDKVTAALSQWADLRVIWGGDSAVEAIRKHPLRPSARDLTFPDRTSWAALSADGWRAADPAQRRAAVLGFTNDSYWFDQAACSSPRTVFLVGDDTDGVREEFVSLLLDMVGQRGWEIDAAMAVEKRVNAYGMAATGAISAMEFPANSVTAMSLITVPDAPRRWIGAGAFPFAQVGSLLELVPAMNRQDQTFSHFGFTSEQLREFALALGGRGVDRIVPFGQALTFGSIWDGYDLPREFTRLTTLVE
ncbi:gamma-glutamyl phosphate reductase [Actinoplanes sp. LDG1-06]|uniref:Gamma-glutamyl phosphate reductase n=1 Tax=Paractinoplanes ovalisporus TaxID=2810368 RepID=A0ABS2AFE9_9ACTN|nr:acyl-CoA reductase [Actinoplanes ovalisporus]MBM2618128.1 gamma-glutamyl phosphate reductase [Actinoplanes ovalisporus]